MLKIAIVDDEQEVLDYLKCLLEHFFKEYFEENETVEIKIVTYLSGIQMLDDKKQPDIVFLDMEMPDMDGIEVGRQLRKRNSQCKIIMATGNVTRFKESFQINAFRYVTKPFDKEEIYEAVKECLVQRIGMNIVEVFFDRIPCKIMEKNIDYIQAYNGYTYIYSEGRQYRSEQSLIYYRENLDERLFFQVHRQSLINLLKVERYEKGKVWICGQEIKIARTKQKAFEAAYMKVDTL